ncbi:MAG: tryptophan synthase subunit alpha [Alphaproteobacteria bacterium]|nr:tryptophan synthase subunit alpha [Alphaproteobacteria bacterium]
MPHLVLGYPSFGENAELIDTMVGAGAEIIEMQIPFSEPMSDGPVILKANDEALKKGANTTKCLDFAKETCAKYPDTIFVFMTYYNISFAYGISRFLEKALQAGIQGVIVPDLPHEEGEEFLFCCKEVGLSPIFIFTPTNTEERLKDVSQYCEGMVYCVGRKGVTGIKTQIDSSLDGLIKKYRKITNLPLALGFGIQDKNDIQTVTGKVDIAVIGTKILMIQQKEGIPAVGEFLKALRE